MESCRQNCPIILALKYKIAQKQEIIAKRVDQAFEQADSLAQINDEIDTQDNAITNARAVLNNSLIKASEAMNRNDDWRVSMLEQSIDDAAARCEDGPQYQLPGDQVNGRMILVCGGFYSKAAQIDIENL